MEIPAAFLIARSADAHRMSEARLDGPVAARPTLFARAGRALAGVARRRSASGRAPRRASRAAEVSGCATA
ncbi:hypothetical protein GCM10020369_15970 [Cryptosporangium minutisporangium]|uniref:Uncharacterized protein n=2 Tax=Cryptosporangium minutisporangium TaxID=113569 RepID=A0ABP6SUE3_9ACTN